VLTLYSTHHYRFTERKKIVTVRAKIGYVLVLLVHSKVVVEVGRNVFLVDFLLWKTLNVAKINITERARTCSCTWNDVIRSFFFISVPLSVWWWHRINHHVTRLEAH